MEIDLKEGEKGSDRSNLEDLMEAAKAVAVECVIRPPHLGGGVQVGWYVEVFLFFLVGAAAFGLKADTVSESQGSVPILLVLMKEIADSRLCAQGGKNEAGSREDGGDFIESTGSRWEWDNVGFVIAISRYTHMAKKSNSTRSSFQENISTLIAMKKKKKKKKSRPVVGKEKSIHPHRW